ncbi:MAG: hypothetical protein AWU54_422 [Candidatus Frackibacter sp. T328-2]|jgi:amino acid transporter|nr:MAG: hypothetical protein AWU54_422 [Candidatus Frackibacter sp. T328-2]
MKEKALNLITGLVFISILAGVVKLLDQLFKSYSEYVFLAVFGLFFLYVISLMGEVIRREWKGWKERREVEKTLNRIIGR